MFIYQIYFHNYPHPKWKVNYKNIEIVTREVKLSISSNELLVRDTCFENKIWWNPSKGQFSSNQEVEELTKREAKNMSKLGSLYDDTVIGHIITTAIGMQHWLI